METQAQVRRVHCEGGPLDDRDATLKVETCPESGREYAIVEVNNIPMRYVAVAGDPSIFRWDPYTMRERAALSIPLEAYKRAMQPQR